MKRMAVAAGVLCAGGMLVLLFGGCSNRESLLEPAEKTQRHYTSVQSFDDPVLAVEPDVIVAIPATKELKVIDDPWVCGQVLSILSAKERDRFFSLGVVYVDDLWMAAEIVLLAGMAGADVSGGVWVGNRTIDASLGCIKCCIAGLDCCCKEPEQDEEKDKG